MSAPLSAAPATSIEAILRSPLGEVRVWIQPSGDGGELRTSIRHDDLAGADTALTHDGMARVAAQLDGVVRRLVPVARATPEASPIARWLAERVDAAPSVRTFAADLYRDFLNWCDANTVRPVSQRAFGDYLSERGFRRAGLGPNGLAYRGGLRLKPAPVVIAAAATLAEAVG